MANVLLERETVDGEACDALLNNKWDEYLAHEDEIIARKEAEEAAARARDEKLADPNWREKESMEAAAPHQQLPQAPAPYGQQMAQQPPTVQAVPRAEGQQAPVIPQGGDNAEVGRFDPGYVNQVPPKQQGGEAPSNSDEGAENR